MRATIAIVLAAVVLSASLAASQGSSSASLCGSYTSCTFCTDMPGCGWDKGSSACEAGSSTGPTNGVSFGTWYYGTGSCTCSANTNCNQCLSGTSCGWDGSTCRLGNSNGPTDGGATTGTWDYGICFNGLAAAEGLATAVLIAIILIPLVILLCIVGCVVYCCCFRRTVVVQQGYQAAVY